MARPVIGIFGRLAIALVFLAMATLQATDAQSASSFARQRMDALKITVPTDPCGAAWSRVSKKYGKPITFGGASLNPQTLFNLKCNEYKDKLTTAIRQPIDDARARAEGAVKGAYNAALNEMRNSFLSWAAEVAREKILLTLPPDEQAKYDPNSPLVQQKAQEWLAAPENEIGTYVNAFINEHAPRVGAAFSAYTDIVSGQSKGIIDGLKGILAKARARIAQIDAVRTEAAAKPDTPIADILQKHGLSGRYIDNFKGYEGKIRGLNKAYRIKDTVNIIVGSFQTDDPRAKINAMFELIDVVSSVASESRIPLVSLFGDIVNAYAKVGKEMLAKIDGLADMIKKRGGYCVGTGAGGGDPRSPILDARDITACPLAYDTSPWKDIFENVQPPAGRLYFWANKKFTDGAPGGGGKAGVQETIKLMAAAGGLGYTVKAGDLAAIAKVYNTPFSGGVPGLMREARTVMSEIAGAARRVNSAIGFAGSCSRDTIIAQVENMTGLSLKAFLDEVQTEGQSRLVTTYAASYVAKNGGFGDAGGKRAGAYDRYRDIWKKIKDVRIASVFGEVRDLKATSAPCAKCGGAILSVKVTGGQEVRSCEVWKADNGGKFTIHVVANAPGMSVALSAEVKDARSETLTVSLNEGANSALLLIKFKDDDDEEDEDKDKDKDKEDEDDPQACAEARAQITAAATYAQNGNHSAAERMLEAAEKADCEDLGDDIAGVRATIDEALTGVRETAAGALQSCEPATIGQAISKLQDAKSASLASEIDKLTRASAAITAADAAIPAAERMRGTGNFSGARQQLTQARSALTAAGLSCAETERKIDDAIAAIDKLERLVAAADQALQQCVPEPMKSAATDLGAFSDAIATDKAAALTRAAALIAQSDQAYEAAKAPYRKGDPEATKAKLKEAKAALDQLNGQPPCPKRQQRIANADAKADALADALRQPESALASCNPTALKAAYATLKKSNHPRLAALRSHIQAVRGLLGAYRKAADAFKSGKLDTAESGLNAISAKLNSASAATCPDLRRRVANGLRKINALRRKRQAVESAIRACNIDAMKAAASELSGKPNPYLRSLPGKIRKALPQCVRERANEACKRQLGDPGRAINIKSNGDFRCGCTKGYELNKNKTQCVRKRSRQEIAAEGRSQCHSTFGVHSQMIRRNKDGTYKCRCDKGYEFNKAGNQCVRKPTRAEIMAEGHRQCRGEFGSNSYAFKPNRNGTYECRCRKGYVWNKARTSCKRRPRASDGHGECRQTFGPQAYSVRVNKNGTFQCQCKRGYRMDQGAKRCVRQARASDGNAQCRKNFGAHAYSIRANRNGTFQCQCRRGYEWNSNRTRCRRASIASGHAACKRQFGSRSYATSYRGNGSWNCFTPPVIRIPPVIRRPPTVRRPPVIRRPPTVRRPPTRRPPTRRPPSKPGKCTQHNPLSSKIGCY